MSVFAGASQVGESLSRLYRRLQSIEQKYTVMLDLVALDDRSLEPFYVRSLNELVYGDLTHYRANKSTFDQWEALTRTIVMELGDIKGQSASIPIWQLARTAESSMLKAESLIALGRMNAQEYAPKISTMLQVLNLNQRPDKEAAEIEAYGAVTALGRMKADDGLEPVFYASIGWYQDRVTELADKFLLTSFKDPVPALIAIIEDAQEYPVKRKALEVVFRTEAPVEEKVKAPLIALQLGLHSNETDKALKIEQAKLRMDAITAYITLDTSHPSMPVLLNDSIDEGVLDEKLIAIQALGTDGSISAVEKLSP